ncbi:MAG: hypothetical protein R2909_16475 [Gemmatimonadales bacterium]
MKLAGRAAATLLMLTTPLAWDAPVAHRCGHRAAAVVESASAGPVAHDHSGPTDSTPSDGCFCPGPCGPTTGPAAPATAPGAAALASDARTSRPPTPGRLHPPLVPFLLPFSNPPPSV